MRKAISTAAAVSVLVAVTFELSGSAAGAGDLPVVVYSYGPQSGAATSVVVRGSSSDDEVLVQRVANEATLRITNPGGVQSGQGCESIDAATADCVLYKPDQVVTSLSGGHDAFRMGSDEIRGKQVEGGAGSDHLSGGGRDDTLVGDSGSDQLIGGFGPDRLFGSDGHDELVGGPGDDRLHADDGMRDRAIKCGPGERDVAVIDEIDIHPQSCETVKVG